MICCLFTEQEMRDQISRLCANQKAKLSLGELKLSRFTERQVWSVRGAFCPVCLLYSWCEQEERVTQWHNTTKRCTLTVINYLCQVRPRAIVAECVSVCVRVLLFSLFPCVSLAVIRPIITLYTIL